MGGKDHFTSQSCIYEPSANWFIFPLADKLRRWSGIGSLYSQADTGQEQQHIFAFTSWYERTDSNIIICSVKSQWFNIVRHLIRDVRKGKRRVSFSGLCPSGTVGGRPSDAYWSHGCISGSWLCFCGQGIPESSLNRLLGRGDPWHSCASMCAGW